MDTLQEYQKLELSIILLFDLIEDNLYEIDPEEGRGILPILESHLEKYRFLCETEYDFQPVNCYSFFYSVMFLHEIVSWKYGIYRKNHPMYQKITIRPRNQIIGVNACDATQGRLEEIYCYLYQLLSSFKSS